MADISDVEDCIVTSVTSILYPAGSSQSSIIGSLCRVYRGWPNIATLNADLSSGAINVTINAVNESGRSTTRYLPQWRIRTVSPGTTVTVSAATISFGGTPAVGDVVGALISGAPYVYRVQSGDTVDQLASNMAQLIQSTCPATANGSVVVIQGARSIVARVVCDATGVRESRRQEKDIQLACWCPDPASRDAVALAIDSSLAETPFVTLSDSTNAHLYYKNTSIFDQAQNARLYRRDLIYSVEYPTVATACMPEMIFGDAVINGYSNYG